jgi:hypothetical protein
MADNQLNTDSVITTATAASYSSSSQPLQKHKPSYFEEEFWWACESNDLVAFEHLLQENPSAGLTGVGTDGTSPLYIAAYRNANDVFSLLVTSYTLYIDVDQQNLRTGLTPLHAACAVGNLEAVQLLLKKGADVNLMSHRGTTPYDTAVYMKQHAIVDYLDHHCNTLDKDAGVTVEVEMWHCHVCTKSNSLDHAHCVVCGRANVLLEHKEEEMSLTRPTLEEEAMLQWDGDKTTEAPSSAVPDTLTATAAAADDDNNDGASVVSELTELPGNRQKSAIKFG